jgi:hypothetical protein
MKLMWDIFLTETLNLPVSLNRVLVEIPTH